LNPALSVIFFTTASGAGYGMLLWLGALAAAAELPAQRGFLGLALGLALLLISAGLVSSSLHLGQPQRAWRAFSQWRTSWLSREAVVAALSLLPLGLALYRWVWLGASSPFDRLLGVALAAGGVLTIFCTARIYTSLKTIAAWRAPLVLPVYLLLGAYSGALLLLAIALPALGADRFDAGAIALAVALFGMVAGIVKVHYWRLLSTTPLAATMNSATGLPGTLRSFERPHTEENYLLREMGFVLARKHARRLRRLAIVFAFVVPILALMLIEFVAPTLRIVLAGLAASAALLGVGVERWLFFAEARHVVTLYYGAAPEHA
jgi:sulfite dehydrogenase (quinone) subunit SoeC